MGLRRYERAVGDAVPPLHRKQPRVGKRAPGCVRWNWKWGHPLPIPSPSLPPADRKHAIYYWLPRRLEALPEVSHTCPLTLPWLSTRPSIGFTYATGHPWRLPTTVWPSVPKWVPYCFEWKLPCPRRQHTQVQSCAGRGLKSPGPSPNAPGGYNLVASWPKDIPLKTAKYRFIREVRVCNDGGCRV